MENAELGDTVVVEGRLVSSRKLSRKLTFYGTREDRPPLRRRRFTAIFAHSVQRGN